MRGMAISPLIRCGAGLAAFCLVFVPAARAESAASPEFFEKRIRPLFAEKCGVCHGPPQRMAGLDLTTAAGFEKGSDAGPLTNPENPAAGRLLRAVGYGDKIKMPPTGKLSDSEIADLAVWMKAGAPWPDDGAAVSATKTNRSDPQRKSFTDEEKRFWAFQPVRQPALPAVRNMSWVRTDIDRFILANLEEKGLTPAAPADRLTLLRRASFDLTGLPPSEEEVRQFLADDRPEAFARTIERLLASPRYGERWGRHWLDVARYADSTGADEDHRYPHAWRYRDYVIEAFNNDLPYDQFIREQIAGDLLHDPRGGEVNVRGTIATGFLALGPRLIAEQDKPKMFYDAVDDQIDVLGKAVLGLTIACARCHDHKFDPIRQTDYYALASIFASTKQFKKLEGTVSQLFFAALVGKAEYEKYQQHQEKIDDKQKEIDAVIAAESTAYVELHRPRLAEFMVAAREVYEDDVRLAEAAAKRGIDERVLRQWVDYLRPTAERRAYLEEFYFAEPAKLAYTAREYQRRFEATAAERKRATEEWEKAAAAAKAQGKEPGEKPKYLPGDDRFYTEVSAAAGPFGLPKDEKAREIFFSSESRDHLTALRSELQSLKKNSPPEPPMACGFAEGDIIEQRVFIRGNVQNPGEAVPKRFPLILAGQNPKPVTRGSGRRELAEWLASPGNPLTARVMVNRIWQWHFGEGIVRTASNFGKTGEPPTHPELLDYLAAKFIGGGWSVKAMHRLIMLSNAYQTSTFASPEALRQDAENRLFSRFHQRRMDVEEIRDTLLALDGSLDLKMGGPMLLGMGTDQEFSDDRKSLDPDQTQRRTVYLPLRRSNLPTLLNLFDFGDATTHSEMRQRTNVAPQALYMMNSPFVAARARAMALRLLADEQLTDAERVEHAFFTILGRPPEARQVDDALAYMSGFPGQKPGQEGLLKVWTSFCRTLIASSDFLYLN